MSGNGTHRNGNGFANGQATRSGYAPAGPVLSTKSVNELLELFEATGDQAPFEEIVRRYAGMVYNVCYQVSRDSHEAEDATQAVFLTLAVRSKTAQKIQYLGPWLQRVAQRLSLDMKRSKKRRAAREVKHHDLNVSRWEENNGPHDLGMDELRGILRDEIDRLPTKYRMPLILHYFGGLKPEEMSKELGIKANTLGVRLHRARKMLGDNLQKKGIVVGGAMLGAALATLVPMYIQQTIATKASAAMAMGSIGHSLVAAEVTAQVLGAMRVASRAAILGKIKAVTAAVAIGAAAVAGAGQLIRTIQHNGLEFRQLFDPGRWLAPLMDRFRAPVRLSDGGAAVRLEQILNDRLEDSQSSFAGAVFVTPQDRADRVFVPVEHNRVLASANGLGAPQKQLHGGLTTARLDPPVPTPQASSAASRALLSATAIATWNAPRPSIIAAPPQVSRPAAVATEASVGARFDRAVGSFRLEGGSIDRPAITLDSRSQPLRSFHLASRRITTKKLTVAEDGEASFLQTGGDVQADQLTLAVAPTAVARYTLEGGQLSAEQQTIGQAGLGVMNQTAGVNTAGAIALGAEPTGRGQYTLAGGALSARSLEVGVRGIGTFNQSAGKATIRGDAHTGGVRVAVNDGSRGTLNLSGGTLQADKVFVGLQGDGTYTQVNGQTVTDKIVIGAGDSSDSRFLAIDGAVVFDSSFADTPQVARSGKLTTLDYSATTAGAFTVAAGGLHQSAIVVGLNGDGVFQLGNARNSARLSEGLDGSRTPLVIRASPSARGEVIGWGDVNVRGPLVNNGKLIADGFGQSRVLDLSSVASVTNTIENDVDGAHGLYAQRNGQLKLPAINVARDGDYNWGETPSDPVIDLVNSVRIGFDGVRAPGTAKLTLLSPDDASATTQLGAPGAAMFVGLWKFDRVQLEADSTRLLVRYDEQMVEHLGLPESALSLWAFDGAWRQLSLAETVLDTGLNLIGGEWAGRFEYFGVSVSALAGGLAGGASDPFYIPGLIDSKAATSRSASFIHAPQLVFGPAVPQMEASGATTGVPEPASAAVVLVGAMLLAGRRRRVA